MHNENHIYYSNLGLLFLNPFADDDNKSLSDCISWLRLSVILFILSCSLLSDGFARLSIYDRNFSIASTALSCNLTVRLSKWLSILSNIRSIFSLIRSRILDMNPLERLNWFPGLRALSGLKGFNGPKGFNGDSCLLSLSLSASVVSILLSSTSTSSSPSRGSRCA